MFNRIRNTKPDNYAFLLCGLLLLFLLMPLLHSSPGMSGDPFVMRIGLQAGYCGLMLLGIWSLHRHNKLFRLGMALTVLSLVFTVIDIIYTNIVFSLCLRLAVLSFSAISAVIVVKHVFRSATVDRNLLFGAICVYLLMGFIWAILYGFITQFWPGSFNGMESPGGTVTMDNLLYYSFVTMAGLGYGDITPVAPLARTLAYMEVIAGQLYIAIMLAGLVGIFLNERNSQ
jgi:voltage-gated potassium channel